MKLPPISSHSASVKPGIGWAAALPAGATLAILSAQLIRVIYGDKWLPAAPALAALGMFGALRVVFDIFNGYLYAQGRARPVLWVQVIWFVALTTAMIPATRWFGIIGAGWAHVLIGFVIVLPAYLVTMHRVGIRIRLLFERSLRPTLATLPAGGAALTVKLLVANPWAAFLAGGSAAVATYAAVMWPWALQEWRGIRPVADTGEAVLGSEPVWRA